jgi:hypothetical protein
MSVYIWENKYWEFVLSGRKYWEIGSEQSIQHFSPHPSSLVLAQQASRPNYLYGCRFYSSITWLFIGLNSEPQSLFWTESRNSPSCQNPAPTQVAFVLGSSSVRRRRARRRQSMLLRLNFLSFLVLVLACSSTCRSVACSSWLRDPSKFCSLFMCLLPVALILLKFRPPCVHSNRWGLKVL